jgi:hypothetical protein
MVKFFKKEKKIVGADDIKEYSKKIKKFIKKNKKEYLEMQNLHSKLFNDIGAETKSEPAQLQFTGVVIYSFLYSIKCSKENKKKLLENVIEKL